MKKKVSELSLLQALSICEENVCDECPLKITLNGMGKTPCVHCLLRFYEVLRDSSPYSHTFWHPQEYCPHCGQRLDWEGKK